MRRKPILSFKPVRSFKSSRDWNRLSFGAFAKVTTDLVLTAILMLILGPVMLAIAVAVSLDGGPILFMHRRVGKGGQLFSCLKFRSMIMNSTAVLDQHLNENSDARDEWSKSQKLMNDPRITKIGRFLRATSLDELPQLFNVLRLEMSLVGPRPIVENELPRYGRHVSYYLQTRPGVTGLWQVNGRSKTSYARRVALDSWYVKSWRFSRDMAILFRTVSVVVRRDGAQ